MYATSLATAVSTEHVMAEQDGEGPLDRQNPVLHDMVATLLKACTFE